MLSPDRYRMGLLVRVCRAVVRALSVDRRRDDSRSALSGKGGGAGMIGGDQPALPLVLLVEDDHQDAFIVRELLEDSGLAVRLEWARSLDDARRALARERAQCVLLDLGLPDARDLSALAVVREASGDAAGAGADRAGRGAPRAWPRSPRAPRTIWSRARSRPSGSAARSATRAAQAGRAGGGSAASRAAAGGGERPTGARPAAQAAAAATAIGWPPVTARAGSGAAGRRLLRRGGGRRRYPARGHRRCLRARPRRGRPGVCLRIAWRTLVLSGVTGTDLLRQLDASCGRSAAATRRSSPCDAGVEPDRHRAVWRAGHPGLLVHSGTAAHLGRAGAGPGAGLPTRRSGPAGWSCPRAAG